MTLTNVFAYLPAYNIHCTVLRSESFKSRTRGKERSMGGFSIGGVLKVMPMGDITINGEECKVGAEGPIRFYFTHLMPHIPGEPLLSVLEADSVAWMDKNMPVDIPGQIRKPTTAHDREVAEIQKVFIEKLKEYREEIGKLYNEYVKIGADTSDLVKLSAEWRQIASSKDWRRMKDRGKGVDAIDNLQGQLIPYGSFDKKIWNAYGPVIDGKLARYESYKKKQPSSMAAEEELAKMKRIAANARRQAEEASEEAWEAETRAEEAERKASNAAAAAWAAQQDANRARSEANAARMDADAARMGW